MNILLRVQPYFHFLLQTEQIPILKTKLWNLLLILASFRFSWNMHDSVSVLLLCKYFWLINLYMTFQKSFYFSNISTMKYFIFVFQLKMGLFSQNCSCQEIVNIYLTFLKLQTYNPFISSFADWFVKMTLLIKHASRFWNKSMLLTLYSYINFQLE